MKMPRRIKLGGFVVAVDSTDQMNNAGDWASVGAQIRVNTHMTECEQAETLLHEIIEAINYYGGLELEHPQLTSLSAWLFAAIRQNKLTFL